MEFSHLCLLSHLHVDDDVLFGTAPHHPAWCDYGFNALQAFTGHPSTMTSTAVPYTERSLANFKEYQRPGKTSACAFHLCPACAGYAADQQGLQYMKRWISIFQVYS
jgi:hypothetical protein